MHRRIGSLLLRIIEHLSVNLVVASLAPYLSWLTTDLLSPIF